jgi:hypothetical protein
VLFVLREWAGGINNGGTGILPVRAGKMPAPPNS